MSQDSEELSEVFEEEEEEVGIKKVYETKQIRTISVKIEQKHLVDEDNDIDMGSDSEIDSAVQEAQPSDESDHFEDQMRGKAQGRTFSPPKRAAGELTFHEREQEYLKSIKRKRDIMEEMIKAEREKECTFQPDTRERTEPYSFDEFLRKQDEHLKKREQFYTERSKQKEINDMMLIQNKPNINDSSRVLALNMGSTNERLLGKKFRLASQSPAREKAERKAGIKGMAPTFIPTISDKAKGLKREGKIEENLYSDAMRRKTKDVPTGPVFEESKRMTNADLVYIQKRFEREFNACAEEVPKETLDYEDLNKFLKAFGCIVSVADEELLPELWKILEGEKRGGVTKANLNHALKAILRVPMESITTSTETFFSPDGNLELSDKHCVLFNKKFSRFHVNKRHNNQVLGYDSKSTGEGYSFKPQISKKTEELAALARSKVEGNTIAEKLLQQQRKYDDWKTEQRKLKEQEEVAKNCTFRPQITELDPKICKSALATQKAMLEKNESKDKCMELFELSKYPKKAPVENVKTEPAPEVKPKNNGKKKPKAGPPPKAYEGAISRLLNARKEKELLKAMKDKGFTYAGNGKEMKKSSSERGETMRNGPEMYNTVESIEAI